MRGNVRQGLASKPRRLRRRVRAGPVDDVEAERELVAHLLLPLRAERRRAEDQDAPHAAAQDQLGQDEARLDRLAEPDVVGEEERDPRHPQRLEQRHELEVLDLDGAVEGRRERKPLDRTRAVRDRRRA